MFAETFITFLMLISTSWCAGQYVYPCELNDYSCIRTILSANSDCDTLIFNNVPELISFNNVQYQVPFQNSSVQQQYSNIKNIDNCCVSAFFFNVTSNVLVMGLDCPNLVITGQQVWIKHNPNAENEYYSLQYTTSFPLTHLTANLRHANNIDLCDTTAYAYITAVPKYQIIPDDDQTNTFLKTRVGRLSLRNFGIYIGEAFQTTANKIFQYYVRYMLCDFGCNTNYENCQFNLF